MTTFKLYFKLIRKNLAFILATLIIFYGISLINYSSHQKTTADQLTDQKDQVIGICNLGKGPDALSLVAYLDRTYRTRTSSPDPLTQKADLFSGKYQAIITIPEDFELPVQADKKPVQIQLNPRSYQSIQVKLDLESFLQNLNALSLEDPAPDQPGRALARGEKALQIQSLEAPILNLAKLQADTTDQEKLGNLVTYFRFAGFVATQNILFTVSLLLLKLNLCQTLSRVRVSALSSNRRETEIYLANLCLALVIWLVLTLPGYWMFAQVIEPKTYLALSAKLLVYTLATVGISHLLSGLTNNPQVIIGAANTLTMVFAMISGVFVPYALLPNFARKMSLISPLHYYVRSLDFSLGRQEVWLNIVIVALFGLASFAGSLSLRARQRRLNQLVTEIRPKA